MQILIVAAATNLHVFVDARKPMIFVCLASVFCFFVITYQKNKVFLIFYVTVPKKTKKTNFCNHQSCRPRLPPPSTCQHVDGSEILFFLVFLVQSHRKLRKLWFFWYVITKSCQNVRKLKEIIKN